MELNGSKLIERPRIVYVTDLNDYRCGDSLIRRKHVLHCIDFIGIYRQNRTRRTYINILNASNFTLILLHVRVELETLLEVVENHKGSVICSYEV